MYYLALVLVELMILLFLSARLSRTLYLIFYFIFRSREVASALLTLLYLPGTVVHELAHLIIAEILRVPTGEISFTPQITTENQHQEIQMGSLKVGATDPVRRFLIGFAPVLFGLFFISLIIWVFTYYWPGITDTSLRFLFLALIAYLLFAVSNSMFLSKKDLAGSEYFLPVVALVVAALYFAGVRVNLTGATLNFLLTLLQGIFRALSVVLGVNTVILLINLVFLRGLMRIFHFKA